MKEITKSEKETGLKEKIGIQEEQEFKKKNGGRDDKDERGEKVYNL